MKRANERTDASWPLLLLLLLMKERDASPWHYRHSRMSSVHHQRDNGTFSSQEKEEEEKKEKRIDEKSPRRLKRWNNNNKRDDEHPEEDGNSRVPARAESSFSSHLPLLLTLPVGCIVYCYMLVVPTKKRDYVSLCTLLERLSVWITNNRQTHSSHTACACVCPVDLFCAVCLKKGHTQLPPPTREWVSEWVCSPFSINSLLYNWRSTRPRRSLWWIQMNKSVAAAAAAVDCRQLDVTHSEWILDWSRREGEMHFQFHSKPFVTSLGCATRRRFRLFIRRQLLSLTSI